jgi:hypothetical protein
MMEFVYSDQAMEWETEESAFNPQKKHESWVFSKASRRTLEPTQRPIQGVERKSSQEKDKVIETYDSDDR